VNAVAQRFDRRAEPAPELWRGMMRDHWSIARDDPRSLHFRSQVGLPVDRPIVMTGHQPLMVHPGVLAKYLAASALADRDSAHAAFLVVDQDETDPGAFEVPDNSPKGELIRRTVRILPAPPDGVPAGCHPAQQAAAIELPHSDWPFVRDGLNSIADAFNAHKAANSLAEQSAQASFELMRPLGIEGTALFATRLARTDLFRELIERMQRNPVEFVERYNAAVAAHPEAKMAPLIMSSAADRYELPLWALGWDAPRRRVYEEDLCDIPTESLAPRALFMTLLVRLAGCDLFIHGAGGWIYDRITEQLSREWLGEELAPMCLATATVTLPLLDAPPPDEADVARAKWIAHHAAHDPASLGDPDAAHGKAGRLHEIAELPRRSPERAAAFRAMHAELAVTRAAHRDELERLRADARETAALSAAASVALDRTWAFPLYPAPLLRELRERIAGGFA
jgi:hypothetical protein